MFLLMKRDNVQTVTLPILVEADTKEADDWGTFFPGDWKGSMFVRIVTEQDVRQWLRTVLSPKEADVFLGLSNIKMGFDEHDEYTLMRGYEKLRPLVKGLVPPEERVTHLTMKDGSKVRLRSGG